MKPALVLVKDRTTSQKNGTQVLKLLKGVAIPKRKFYGEEGAIRKTLRVAKDGDFFIAHGSGSSHIYEAARAVGVKVATRKYADGKYGVWVRKPQT